MATLCSSLVDTFLLSIQPMSSLVTSSAGAISSSLPSCSSPSYHKDTPAGYHLRLSSLERLPLPSALPLTNELSSQHNCLFRSSCLEKYNKCNDISEQRRTARFYLYNSQREWIDDTILPYAMLAYKAARQTANRTILS